MDCPCYLLIKYIDPRICLAAAWMKHYIAVWWSQFCRVFILFPIPLYVSLLFPICSSSHNKISNTPLSLLVSNPPPRSLQVVGARTRLHLKPLKSFSSSAHSKSVIPSPRLSQSLQGAGAKTHYISNHFIFHPFSSSTHN